MGSSSDVDTTSVSDRQQSASKSVPKKRGASGKSKKTGPKRPLARRIVRWILLVWLVVLLVVGGVLVLRTLLFKSKQLSIQQVQVTTAPQAEMAARLAAAIRIQTVNTESAVIEGQAFYDLHEHLRVSFPRVHSTLVRENVADYSLLYTWRGSEPHLPALVFAGHMDVVPAEGENWAVPPFSGRVDTQFVHGRGSLDDKVTVLALLEAAEQLLSEGFVPTRTLYFAFGHDEESGGHKGAFAIAQLLAARGVKAEAILDEGMVITEGILDGIDKPVALIGIAEKGLVNLELQVRSKGGHSSMPSKDSAIDLLSRALVKLRSHPMPGGIDGAVKQMFSYVGPEFGFGKKLVMANLWLFGPLVRGALSEKPATDALLRTTTAPTLVSGGIKSNVLPRQAKAIVNFRVKPGDSVDEVVKHCKEVIGDARVEIRIVDSFAPQPSSSTSSAVYQHMARSIRALDPTIVVAPGLMLGYTDSRHYAGIVKNSYRFTALRLGPDDLQRLHGRDERISIANYSEVVAFNVLMLRASSQLSSAAE